MSSPPRSYYYPDGSLKERIQLSNGKKNGNYESYYNKKYNNALKSRGKFVNDLENGYWEYFRPDGNLESTGIYTLGALNGLWSFYDEEGFKFSDVEYKNDMKNGLFIEYYPNGQVIREGKYKDDLENGIFKTYYENKGKDVYEIMLYKDGVITGIKVFDEKGKLITVEGEDPEYLIEYDSQGEKIAEGNLLDGQKEGIWIYYIPTLRAIEFVNDKKIKEINYYNNTQKIKKTTEYLDNETIEKYYDEVERIKEKIIIKKDTKDLNQYFYYARKELFDKDGNTYVIFLDRLKYHYKNVNLKKLSDVAYETIEKGIMNDKNLYVAKGKMKVGYEEIKNGPWTYTFDSEKYKVEYKEGIPNGKFESWIKEENDWIKYSLGFFDNGKKSQDWFYYENEEIIRELFYDNGKLLVEIIYKDDVYDKIFTSYNEKGIIEEKIGTINKIKYYKDGSVEVIKNYNLVEGGNYLQHDEIRTERAGVEINEKYVKFSGDDFFILLSLEKKIDEVNYEIKFFDWYDYNKNTFEEIIQGGLFKQIHDMNTGNMYNETYDATKNKLTIWFNNNENNSLGFEGEPVKIPANIDSNDDFEMFDENNPWEWFRDYYILIEKNGSEGLVKEYRVDRKEKRLIGEGLYDEFDNRKEWISYEEN